MLTEKDYCDYDTCVALKELGYPIDWFEDETYHENNTEISLYEAQKFLREEKNVHITINYICLDENIFMYTLRYIGKKLREGSGLYNNKQYSSCEEALAEGLREAIEILKEED